MGTKRNPGPYDCYAKAHPDEPLFILLGRDPDAGLLVQLWTFLRSASLEQREVAAGVVRAMMTLQSPHELKRMTDADKAKIAEAFRTADALRRWAISSGKAPV